MKKMAYLIIAVLWLFVAGYSYAGDHDPTATNVAKAERATGEITATAKLIEGASEIGPIPFCIRPVQTEPNKDGLDPDSGESRGVVLILVNYDLYQQVSGVITQYRQDVIADGYNAEVFTINGGDPEIIRSFLLSRYNLYEDMIGSVLIGDLPVAWYETGVSIGTNYPFNYFYMDLNGGWEDTDGDGRYDTNTGNNEAEVFSAIINASTLTALLPEMGEVELLTNYFNKNHLYRTGQGFQTSHRALVYKDDDWSSYSLEYERGLRRGYYIDQTWFYDPATTVDTHYEGQIQEDFEYVILFAHGGNTGHSFYIPSQSGSTRATYQDIIDAHPHANFYILHSCSNGQWLSDNYIAGWYIFNPDYGLVTLASPSAAWYRGNNAYWEALGEGQCIGMAYLQSLDYYHFYAWLSTTIFGDPTLQTVYCDGSSGDGDGDGRADDCDNCPDDPNADQADIDQDYLGDACDDCVDADEDGFGNSGYDNIDCPDPDNCPFASNPGQEDIDNDGPGDACDPCTDTDGDGFGNPGYPATTCTIDNCPDIYNPDQSDGDGDGVGDICDNCPDDYNPGQEDTDGDGYPNGCDNCPFVYNPGQDDSDGNDIGDACDCTGEPTDVWVRTFDFSDDDIFHAMKQRPDGSFILGGEQNNAGGQQAYHLDELNECGKTEWYETSDVWANYCIANKIGLTADGYFVIGHDGDQPFLSVRNQDHEETFGLHYTPYSLFGVRTYGGCPYTVPTKFVHAGQDPNGGAHLYVNRDDGSLYAQHQRLFGGAGSVFYDVTPTSDGNFIATGLTYDAGGKQNAFVVKVDPTMDEIWQSQPGPVTGIKDVGNAIAETSDGGYIIAGVRTTTATGDTDILAMKIDASGQHVWTKTIGNTDGNDEGHAIYDLDGEYFIIAGTYRGIGADHNEAFALKIRSSNGLVCDQWSMLGIGDQVAYDFEIANDQNYVLAGKSAGDFYVGKLDPSGYLCGDANNNGVVDNDDIDFLISYLFMGGPAPKPMELGEVNCDPPISIGDVSVLITYVSGGGDPPCACEGGSSKAAVGHDSPVSVDSKLENGSTVISLSTSIELRALEVTLNGPDEAETSNLTGLPLTIVTRSNQSGITVGILDHTGINAIPSGNRYLISLPGKFTIAGGLAVDTNNREYSLRVGSSVPIPAEFALHQNYPNPFNPTTRIDFSLPVEGHVLLEVFNILGQRVVTLINGNLEAGSHEVIWDGTDTQGNPVASGVYFYRIKTDNHVDSRRMILLK
jgi:hypothetical protein